MTLSNEVKEEERADGEEVFNETQRAAAVVLDVNTFDVLALASFPDFDPQLFVAGIDETDFRGPERDQGLQQPRCQRPLPTRFDIQGHHLHGQAKRRTCRSPPGSRVSTPTSSIAMDSSSTSSPTARRRSSSTGTTRAIWAGSTSTVLCETPATSTSGTSPSGPIRLFRREAPMENDHPGLGDPGWVRACDRHRPEQRSRRHRPDPRAVRGMQGLPARESR